MPSSRFGLDGEQVARRWQQVAENCELLRSRVGRLAEDPVERCALAGDDKRAAPWTTSTAVAQCLAAAADQAHAATTLITGANLLHIAAPFALYRGAIENAATAVWILAPAARRERVERTLRWHSRDKRDCIQSGIAVERAKADLDRIGATGAAYGIAAETARRGYKFTTVVGLAGEAADLELSLPYAIASGMMHGRTWAWMSMLNREQQVDTGDGHIRLKLTNDVEGTLWAAWMSLHAAQAALRLWDQRTAIRH